MTYTVEAVKRDLPNVKVKVAKKVVICKVSNEKSLVATIWIDDKDYDFNWLSIVWSLNEDKPLRIEL